MTPVKTPKIDTIAKRAIRFDSAYCPSPVCIPSGGTLIAGQYAHKHGAKILQDALPDEIPTTVLTKKCSNDAHRPLRHHPRMDRANRSPIYTIGSRMALQINGEYVDDTVIRQEAASMRPRYEEMMQEMDPIAREMQLRDWAKENVIERVLLRQAATADSEPVPTEEIDERLTALFPPAGDLEDCEAGTTRAGVDKETARKDIEAQIRIERLIRQVGEKAPKSTR